MINLVPAKCPSCGAQLELDDNLKRTECKYCKTTIIVDEAIQKYQIEISGEVKVDGIDGKDKILEDAKTYAKLENYDEAIEKFQEYIKKYPGDWEGYYSYFCMILDDYLKTNGYDARRSLYIENEYYKPFTKLAPQEKIDEIDQKYEELYDKYPEYAKNSDLKEPFKDCYINLETLECNNNIHKYYKKRYQMDSSKVKFLKQYHYLDVLKAFNSKNVTLNIEGNLHSSFETIVHDYTFDVKNYCFINNKEKSLSAICKKTLMGKYEPKNLFGSKLLEDAFNLIGIDLNGNPIYGLRNFYTYETFVFNDINLNDYTLEEIENKMSSYEKLEIAQKRAAYLNKLGLKEALKFLNLSLGYNKYKDKKFNKFVYVFKDGKIIYEDESYNYRNHLVILPNTSSIERIELK